MSNNSGDNLKNLKIGMAVEINPQSDRTRKKLVSGKIAEILTNAKTHPHGILVQLESGEKGRVKSIVLNQKTDEPSIDTGIQGKTIQELIDIGENHLIEFKSSAEWSKKLQKDDIKKSTSSEVRQYGNKASKVIIAKTLAGFLNTEGGTLIIGVLENKDSGKDELIGIEEDYKFIKDKNKDGYRRMIEDIIGTYFPENIFNHYNKYLQTIFEEINGKTICGISAIRSDKRVFIKLNNNDHFFIRRDASTREIKGESILKYCEEHFK